jgi:hypothetical protein
MRTSYIERLAWAKERMAYCEEQLNCELRMIPLQGDSSLANEGQLRLLRRELGDARAWLEEVESHSDLRCRATVRRPSTVIGSGGNSRFLPVTSSPVRLHNSR